MAGHSIAMVGYRPSSHYERTSSLIMKPIARKGRERCGETGLLHSRSSMATSLPFFREGSGLLPFMNNGSH